MNEEAKEKLRKVLATATDIAAAAPKRRGKYKYVTNAQIPWSMIEQLRDQLDEIGIDEIPDQTATPVIRPSVRG
jgi:hypothetical protein